MSGQDRTLVGLVNVIRKILLTGAPGSGKTSLASELMRALEPHALLVPEVPRIFLENGLGEQAWSRVLRDTSRDDAFIREIVALRAHLERHFARVANIASMPYLICDRGPLDAASYRDNCPDQYMQITGRSLSKDKARYDLVIHLAPVKGPTRWTDPEDARRHELDRRIEALWESHAAYLRLHADPFETRVNAALNAISRLP